jgi:hypothetical protein
MGAWGKSLEMIIDRALMIKRITTILLFLILVISRCNAQFSINIQTGLGYIEHFSTGIAFGLGNNNLSLIYGSDFFINTSDFSTYMIQYDRNVNRFKFNGFVPKAGIKGGYSIYTNRYYKWTLYSIVPYIGIGYPVSRRMDLDFDLGIAFSEEQSLERIRYGEIGAYKKHLPELKLSLVYHLLKR